MAVDLEKKMDDVLMMLDMMGKRQPYDGVTERRRCMDGNVKSAIIGAIVMFIVVGGGGYLSIRDTTKELKKDVLQAFKDITAHEVYSRDSNAALGRRIDTVITLITDNENKRNTNIQYITDKQALQDDKLYKSLENMIKEQSEVDKDIQEDIVKIKAKQHEEEGLYKDLKYITSDLKKDLINITDAISNNIRTLVTRMNKVEIIAIENQRNLDFYRQGPSLKIENRDSPPE